MARRGHFGLKTAFLNLSIGDMTIRTMTKKTTKKTSTTKTTINYGSFCHVNLDCHSIFSHKKGAHLRYGKL